MNISPKMVLFFYVKKLIECLELPNPYPCKGNYRYDNELDRDLISPMFMEWRINITHNDQSHNNVHPAQDNP